MVPADEIEGNLQSIERIPRRILPAGAAPDALLALARRGEDLYVYASGGRGARHVGRLGHGEYLR